MSFFATMKVWIS